MPMCACLKEFFSWPKSAGGFRRYTFKSLAEKMRLVKRNILCNNAKEDMHTIWKETQGQFIETDHLLIASSSAAAASRQWKCKQNSKASNHLLALPLQGVSLKIIQKTVSAKDISLWSVTIEQASSLIFNFARKALLQVLPTASNLAKWGRLQDPVCSLCKMGVNQTNLHVLSNCSASAALARYTARHNDILQLIVNWLKSVLTKDQILFCDLPEYAFPISELFTSKRPDIAISDNTSLITLELTVCHESNMITSKQYKLDKYQCLADCRVHKERHKSLKNYTVEVSTLGFLSSTANFSKACKVPEMSKSLKQEIIRTVLNSSYKIYCNRNCDSLP